MSIFMEEGYKSRDGTQGQTNSVDLIFYTFGEPDEETARLYVIGHAPGDYNGFPFRTTTRKQLTSDVYEWTCTYGADQNQVNETSPVLQFTVGGGTVHITNSLGTPTKYVNTTLIPGTPPDFKNAIGAEVSSDLSQVRVRGVEVQAPTLDYSLELQLANELVTDAYIAGVYNLALNPVNDAPFFGREAGSVLFKGCRGTKKGLYIWDLIFDFSFSPNASGLVVGDIRNINKTGWQYLDTLYVPPTISRTSTGIKIVQPGMVTVHTVYGSGSFSVLGLGS